MVGHTKVVAGSTEPLPAVLDASVIVSAPLSRDGTPATLLRSWTQGALELVVSPLDEQEPP